MATAGSASADWIICSVAATSTVHRASDAANIARQSPLRGLLVEGLILSPLVLCDPRRTRFAGLRAAPGAFALLLIMSEGGHEPIEHLGCGFEHGLELGFLHPLDVLAQMADRILQSFA